MNFQPFTAASLSCCVFLSVCRQFVIRSWKACDWHVRTLPPPCSTSWCHALASWAVYLSLLFYHKAGKSLSVCLEPTVKMWTQPRTVFVCKDCVSLQKLPNSKLVLSLWFVLEWKRAVDCWTNVESRKSNDIIQSTRLIIPYLGCNKTLARCITVYQKKRKETKRKESKYFIKVFWHW